MLVKTKGIALHQINYSDTSIICYIYTEKYGKLNFLVKGAKRKNANIKANFFQPLFILDLDIYYRSNKNFQQIRELKYAPLLTNMANDIIKKSISLFIAEILYRIIKEEEPNGALFGFISNSIQLLDHLDKNVINFHLFFLTRLTKFIGFLPENNYSARNCYFDLIKGKFDNNIPSHRHYMDKEITRVFANILSNTSHDYRIDLINNNIRTTILEKLIEYYQIHLEGFSNIKSLDVFKEIFR